MLTESKAVTDYTHNSNVKFTKFITSIIIEINLYAAEF